MAPYNNHGQYQYTDDVLQTQQPFTFPGISKPVIVEAPITEEIINKVTQIVNEFIPNTTTVYDNIDDAANAMGVDGNSNGVGANAVTDSLVPDFVSQAGNGIGEVQELTTNFNGNGDSVFGTITSTIRSYISDNEEDSDYHNSIHGGSMEHHAAKNNPYLYLVIVLAVLVVLATVALLVYIRYKRSASAKISPGVSIVGKNFEPHTFGDKTLAGQSALGEQYGACDDAGQAPKPTKSAKK